MKFKNNNKYNLGLALGGGGTRGFAHLGAIKAFEEHGIKFDCIAGTSIGSFVGAFYASGMSAEEMIRHALKLKMKDIRTSKVPFTPNKTDKFEEIIKSAIGDIDFEDLKIPLNAVAVDLKTGNEIIFDEGSVIKAVAGSCALPLLFNPVKYGDYNLIDGGVRNNVPTAVLKDLGCKNIVSIDVNSSRSPGTDSVGVIDVITASVRIMMKDNADRGRKLANVLIEPNTKGYSLLKTEGALDMIEEGYRCALEQIEQVKKLTRIRSRYKQRSVIKKFKRQKRKNWDDKIIE